MRDVRPETTVAYVSDRSDLYGGGQRSLCDLMRALRGTHVRPIVVVPGPGPLADNLSAEGVEWIPVPAPPVLQGAGIGAARAIDRLRRLVLERRVDLLHSDAPRAALYAGVAARLTRRPHVMHLRASRASSSAADRLLVALCDRVIAVSRAAAARSRASRASRKVRVIPTGLHPIDFLPRPESRARLGLPDEAFVLGVVGRVEEDKGRSDALAALPIVRRAVPTAHLAFLGPFDPNDAWTRTVSLRAASAGAPGAVRLLGPAPDAARLLKAFDLLLHPSRHEALPRVILEAQFAEVPVVASAVGGVLEIIDSGENGLLVAPRDAQALGHAAASLALDPETARRLARSGLAWSRERFGMDRMLAAILAVYDEILEGRRAPAARGPARAGTGDRPGEVTS